MSGKLSVSEVSFCWKIPNFCGQHRCVTSRKFSFYSIDGGVHQFWIECYPISGQKEGAVNIHLICSPCITASFDLSIIDKNDYKYKTWSKTNHIFGSDCNRAEPHYIQRDELLENGDLLPGGALAIGCTIRQEEATHSETMIESTDQISRLTELSKNLKTLHLCGDHHDVTIMAGGKLYPAHKSILSARSTVFKAMLTHEMRESKENKIVISDISGNVVKELLEYIYTGEAPKLDELAEELIVAADRYGLETLKRMCASSLSANITAENACKRYLLSSIFNLENMERDIEKFASRNMQSIMDSPIFNEMWAENPDVLKKLLRSLFVKQ